MQVVLCHPVTLQICLYASESLFPGMGEAAGKLLKPFLVVPDELIEQQAAGASKAHAAEELLKILNVSHHSSDFAKDSSAFSSSQFLL